MTCIANLVRPKDLKIIKSEYITRETYSLCEAEVARRNEMLKRKDEAYWTINQINV